MMDEIEVQYQIQAADYAEANARVFKRSPTYIGLFLGSAALLVLLPLLYGRKDEDWRYPVLVIPFAGFLVWCTLLNVFPGWNARLHYRNTALSKRTFKAHFSGERVRIDGQGIAWILEWPAFRIVSESPNLFLFYDGTTMFIFAKRYFAPEQIVSLQQLIKNCWKPAGDIKNRSDFQENS
jgi:hypothetical protein